MGLGGGQLYTLGGEYSLVEYICLLQEGGCAWMEDNCILHEGGCAWVEDNCVL